jgi:hypothetical protein
MPDFRSKILLHVVNVLDGVGDKYSYRAQVPAADAHRQSMIFQLRQASFSVGITRYLK